MGRNPKYVSNGTDLAEALSLTVAQGCFHVDGEFYRRPEGYPCAFFDRRGYLIVDSEETLKRIAGVTNQRVNFRRQVSRQHGYRVGDNWPDWRELAKAQVAKKANLKKAARLLASLSEEEKRQLIKRMRRTDIDDM